MAELVTFLRLHRMLSDGHPDALALNLNKEEGIAVYSITETLLHEINVGKTDMIRSIFTGEGEHLGVPCMYYYCCFSGVLYSPFTQIREWLRSKSGS